MSSQRYGHANFGEQNPYSGFFKQGSVGLVIARFSAGGTPLTRASIRSIGVAAKLYPTTDEHHAAPLKPANLAHIFDKGDPEAKRVLKFDIAVSNKGSRQGFSLLPKGMLRQFEDWQTIGALIFANGVASSYNGDFVLHFAHPTWRKQRNDPATAVRKNGKKVRWF